MLFQRTTNKSFNTSLDDLASTVCTKHCLRNVHRRDNVVQVTLSLIHQLPWSLSDSLLGVIATGDQMNAIKTQLNKIYNKV